MINAAIVGLGWWGKSIADAVQGKSQKLRFVHGVTQELDATREYAQAKGFKLSGTLEAALADPAVQAVVLATPHSLHCRQVIQVAAAGKAVFCEKPLSLTRADAEHAVAACKKAGVPLGVGQNKRFWPSMAGLRRVIASGALGRIMHVEGHYSNEHSSKFFAPWRDLPNETPGAGMTGTGIHILDAFANIAGPAEQITAQFISRREGADPRDTVSVLFKFANGISGFLGAVRASPLYFRVHVFGDEGSVEALGETQTVIRLKGGKTEVQDFPKIDSVLAEIDAFADAVAGVAPYPITTDEMINTIASLEAVIRSIAAGATIRL
ncbi:MAG: gfo/Idh/MocA family oxidoreductase [Betaproteobacteria bacterium]|nr:MAG: gfo/Idh/MocA family oxidoreductase [Betaproteobacteria bacterium]